MNNHLVLVYGSLRQGFHNNALLTRRDAECIRDVEVPDFVMHSLGGFPMIVPAAKAPKEAVFPWKKSIKAELWVVNDLCLEDLDNLEGHPHWYKRTEVAVRGYDGRMNIYVGTQEYVNQRSVGIVTSGSWAEYRDHPEGIIKDWKNIVPEKMSNEKRPPMMSDTTAQFWGGMGPDAERILDRMRNAEIVAQPRRGGLYEPGIPNVPPVPAAPRR